MSNLVQTLLMLSELYFLQLFGGRYSFFIAITDIVVFVHHDRIQEKQGCTWQTLFLRKKCIR